MNTTHPDRLQEGDYIGIIAPSRPLSIISNKTRSIAEKKLKNIGLTPVFSEFAEDEERYTISSIKKRVSDIHKMFKDDKIKGILTAIGGYHAKQLLNYIDWEIIADNPKIFCGYSDTTALSNAIYSKTGLVTYIGPHYSTFGQKHKIDYIINYFQKCCVESEPFEIKPSNNWSDDKWWINQDERNFITNKGPVIINEGKAHGKSVGGNLESFLSLAGTHYCPSLENSILFIEVTEAYNLARFDAKLQSLLLQTDFPSVNTILIGRFQKNSRVTLQDLEKVIKQKKGLNNVPVVSNVDFGHTFPFFTFPIGGEVKLKAYNDNILLEIVRH